MATWYWENIFFGKILSFFWGFRVTSTKDVDGVAAAFKFGFLGINGRSDATGKI